MEYPADSRVLWLTVGSVATLLSPAWGEMWPEGPVGS